MSRLQEILETLNNIDSSSLEKIHEEVVKATVKPWIPNPGPQEKAYLSKADELFYGGQAGPGKTDLGLGLAANEHHRTLFLREYREDAKAASERFLEIIKTRKGWNGQDLRYAGDGISVEFGGCKAEEDKQRYKGDPHDLIVFDEIGDFTQSQYIFISTWNRSADPNQRCRVVCTGNPPTRAKGMWVIKRWAAWLDPAHPNPAEDGELRWYTTDIEGNEKEMDGPGPHNIGGELIYARSRTFIRGKLSDNPDLERTNYDATLAALPPELREAYRAGKFDAALRDQPFQCIPTSWVRIAMDRWKEQPKPGIPMCAMGVDPTGGGTDPMVIAARYDGWFAPMIRVQAKDIKPENAARHAAAAVVAERRDGAAVVVDMGGGYGGPLYERLIDNGIECQIHKGAERSTRRTKDGKLRFTNKRTEVYWKFREALDPEQAGGSPIQIPDDREVLAELTAPTFEVTPNGIKLEPKEKLIARLGRSTNDADAIVMSWSYGPTYVTQSAMWADAAEMGSRPGQKSPKVVMGRQIVMGKRRG